MKHFIFTFLYLLGAHAAFAQDATTESVPAAASAASAPEVAQAASAPEAAAPAVVREGYIYKMQECGDGHSGSSSRWANILKNTVLQVSDKSGTGLLGQVVAADVVGSAAGAAVDGGQEKRQVCVTVAFRDGTDDQVTKVPGSVYDRLKLRMRRPVNVSFVDNKPTDFQF